MRKEVVVTLPIIGCLSSVHCTMMFKLGCPNAETAVTSISSAASYLAYHINRATSEFSPHTHSAHVAARSIDVPTISLGCRARRLPLSHPGLCTSLRQMYPP